MNTSQVKIKSVASISLDLDNQWSYMKIHGDKSWEDFPSYFNIFVPYILDLLDELNLQITFFIVGQDAVINSNKPYLKMIADRGHEIANHSFQHESWLQKYTKEELIEEISLAEEAIFEATGKKTVGFRGPGFSCSETLFEVLAEKEYKYDCSTLPTFIGPIARAYYFWMSDLSKEEKKKRNELFGKFSDGFKPIKPYIMQLKNGKSLMEIPVTTVPILKIPFHLSYLIYLYRISPLLMKTYLYLALFLCRITKTSISFLLHPLDIIGGDDIRELAFFPGMDMPSSQKSKIFKMVLKLFLNRFQIIPLVQHYNSAL